MKKFFIWCLKLVLNFIYFFMKLFPTKNNRIVMVSRQSNSMTLDFRLIKEEILKNDSNMEVIVLTKRLDDIKMHIISYGLFTLKQMFYIATSKVCVVDSYCIPVSVLKHKKSLSVIQIWHSLGAIKEFGYQTLGKNSGREKDLSIAMNMHKNYDAIISGSEAMTVYFAKAFNYDESYFLNYGLPRIDYLLKEKNRLKKSIYKAYPELKKKPVVMYAPTFRTDNSNSLGKLISDFNFNKYHLILKSHPNQIIDSNLDNVYKCPEFTALDLISVCDYVITDYSAIAIEASVLDVKLLYYVYDYEKYSEDNGLNIDLFEDMPGCVFRDSKDLVNALEKHSYNKKALVNYKKKYLPKELGKSTELIVKWIMEHCK